MSVQAGGRLGPYEITAKLGEGGMGEVYRAHDTKLKRDVAIKVLPAAFTEDKERLARFEREAQLLAQLHHQNIASIFGLEESEGVRALVMELVEGPTLAERLESGPLPIHESLSLARQIAEALEEAHEKGIIHRDLKPQNVKASIEGRVKVLDFGLAKAMDPAGAASGAGSASQLAQSPTLTLGATQMGVILGTAAYMAPEQAAGGVADRRSDVWSFGVVLYEMLSGRRLFDGESVSHVLASVLKDQPDFSALPADVPPRIRRLVRRCLQKKARERLQSIGDARLILDEVLTGRGDEEMPVAVPVAAPERRMGVAAIAGVAIATAIVGAAVGYVVASGGAPKASPAAERRFVIPAAGRALTDRQAISRDGRNIAYTAGGQLWLRALSETESRAISGGDGAGDPFWSPDGREIGFVRAGALWRLGVEGGIAKRVCELPTGVFEGGTWSDQGTAIFAVATGGWTGNLWQCPAVGGIAAVLLEPDELGKRLRRPQALPAGAGLLYLSDWRSDRSEVRLLRDKVSTLVYETPTPIREAMVAGRRLYYVRDKAGGKDIWGVDLDARWSPVGEPILVASGGTALSVADGGELLYSAFEDAPRRVALVTRDGEVTPLGEPFRSDVASDVAQFAPDGKRATLVLSDPRSNQSDSQLWLVDLVSGARQRLPLDVANPLAAWSPDGRELLVTDQEKAAQIVPLGGGERRSFALPFAAFQCRYTPDGRWVVFYAITPETGRDLFRVAVDGSSPAEPLVREPGQQANPDVSPDGRYVAYQSDESGRPEIYVRPYPSGDRKWQVSTDGGVSPTWNRRGGGELVWLADNAIWSAPVSTVGAGFQAGAPHVLLRGDAIGADLVSGSIYYSRVYDLSDDGQRFIVTQRASEGRNEIVYVENLGATESRR